MSGKAFSTWQQSGCGAGCTLSSLEVFKTSMNKVKSNLVWSHSWPTWDPFQPELSYSPTSHILTATSSEASEERVGIIQCSGTVIPPKWKSWEKQPNLNTVKAQKVPHDTIPYVPPSTWQTPLLHAVPCNCPSQFGHQGPCPICSTQKSSVRGQSHVPLPLYIHTFTEQAGFPKPHVECWL